MTNYIKWFLEVANQEYKGNIKLFNSNIAKYSSIVEGC